ncbi:hypothetical protein RchiOBHm_Chr7g0232921 [Rosa chinensis]|uniref:Uncharacterized protein n=1 Tax=Rosa chinensis TaxID=74649 RepID=A0A2P6PG18_ROSCH|nr:hypothetical protein RchiOBHm_Chr7g0232921 [Rosa chinensis]
MDRCWRALRHCRPFGNNFISGQSEIAKDRSETICSTHSGNSMMM